MKRPNNLFAYVDVAVRFGMRRSLRRLARRLRFNLVYPRVRPHRRNRPPGETATPAKLPGPTGFSGSGQGTGRLLHGEFTLVNQVAPLGRPVDWQAAREMDPLWAYELHYGEWAAELAAAFLATGEAHYRDGLTDLLGEWIGGNPPGSRPGWEPYPTSRRLVSWLGISSMLAADETFAAFWRERLAPSLHLQARLLASNLETDLGNNHLVANCKALAWAGLLAPGWTEAAAWRRRGLTGLWREAERQVLADGAHFERSMTYHAIVLQDLAETISLARSLDETVPPGVDEVVGRMREFLSLMRGPDGSWPLLNDAVRGCPLGMEALVVDEGRACPPLAVFPEAGWAVLRPKEGECLVFDAGPMGPRWLPGHGHADALSFVLWGAGRPMLVDPGVYSYHDRVWRDRFRCTAAHNTVEIDGRDQCEFLGPFRAALPPEARLLECAPDRLSGVHYGYRRLRPGVTHRRVIRRADERWLVEDSFEGTGRHRFSLALQAAPGARVEPGAAEVCLRWPDGARLTVEAAQVPKEARVGTTRGWVSETWNRKVEAPRLVVEWESAVPCRTLVSLEVRGE